MSQIQALHQEAMDLAESAMTAKLRGDLAQADQLLRQAFEKEAEAAALIAHDLNAEPTRSVLHRSAASLAIDCGEFQVAERLIMTALIGEPPQEIAEELKDLFFQINQPQNFQSQENPWIESEKERYLSLLRQGVKVWNRWREENPNVNPDLSGLSFSGINLDGFDLHNTILWGSNFGGSSLRGTILTKAFLQKAYLFGVDLTGADLRGASLSEATLGPANLYEADFSDADLLQADLNSACLYGAKLRRANLTKADLTGANLTSADLSESILLLTRAVYTNFEGAILTGACIQDWSINERTILSNVICDYVYIRIGSSNELEDRRPSSGNFAPGEFSEWIRRALNTLDLILQNPDWEAFAYSIRKIQVESEGEKLEIQSIENKGDGIVVVRANVSPNADKARIHSGFMKGYELAHNLLEKQYRSEINIKSGEIDRQKGYIDNLFLLLSQQAGIQMAMAENPKVQQTFNISAPITGFAGNVEGAQHIYAPEQRQNLAESAAEIQQLLHQLAQTNPTSTEAVAEAIHQEIKQNPTLKARLVGAFKSGGLEALKAIFNHPLFSIPAETVKGWLEAE